MTQHEQQVAYSKKLLEDVKIAATKGVDSVKNSELNNDPHKKALLVETSILSKDLQHVLYELRKMVTNSNTEPHENQNLIDVLTVLAKTVNNLQLSVYNDDIESTRNELITEINSSALQAEILSTYIENHTNKEDVAKVVRILDDLLSAIDKIELRSVLQHYDTNTLSAFLKDVQHEKDVALNKISSDDEHVLKQLVFISRRAIEQLRDPIHSFEVQAFDYEGEARQTILDVTKILTLTINNWKLGVYNSHNVAELKSHIAITIHMIYRSLVDALRILKHAHDELHVSVNLQNLLLTTLADVLECDRQFARRLKQINDENE